MPEIFFDNTDAIPEAFRSIAAKSADGKYVVDVEPAAKLKEFRDNNVNLLRERDGFVTRMKSYAEVIGDDFDKFKTNYSELTEIKAKLENKTLIENSSFEKALEQRTGELKNTYEGKIQAQDKALSEAITKQRELDQRLRRTHIDRHITDAVLHEKSGARPDAIPDFLERAYRAFEADDNGGLLFKENGEIVYGADAKPMQPLEWVATRVREKSPYLFKESNGGGAGGGGGGGHIKTIAPNALSANLEAIAGGTAVIVQ